MSTLQIARRPRCAARHDVARARRPEPFEVGESLVVRLEASPAEAMQWIRRLDFTSRPNRALEALGFDTRMTARASAADRVRLGLVWRLPSGDAELTWELRVAPRVSGEALLSVSTRIAAADAATRARLLDAWPLVGGLARGAARQLVEAVRAAANADTEDRLAA
jgi:hypothetical protein